MWRARERSEVRNEKEREGVDTRSCRSAATCSGVEYPICEKDVAYIY
jgi:hypothetical protein